ncbi:MAG TPA: hypothetical protein VNZ86_10405, partial [Bacteroidia bacterium]|nr:hypothetical protein [Bacteroidia bacterium]
MKTRFLLLCLSVMLCSPVLRAQRKSYEPFSTVKKLCTMGMMSYREDETKPYFYFPEEVGYYLRLKKNTDKNGVLTEAIFYRQREGGKATDTLEEKQIFQKAKLAHVFTYYNARKYDGKVNHEMKFDEQGRKTEDIHYDGWSYHTKKACVRKEVFIYGTDGTLMRSEFENDIIVNRERKDTLDHSLEWINYDSLGNLKNRMVSQYTADQYENVLYDK